MHAHPSRPKGSLLNCFTGYPSLEKLMIEKRITGVREFIVARRECEVNLRGGWGSEPAPTPAEEKFMRPNSRGR